MVTKASLRNKTVLLTCGPTWVPIDDVRVISNISSGELGHTLANLLAKEGARVTLLEGPVRHRFKKKSVKVIPFQFYDELRQLLFKELKKKYHIVIHAAAVSDYRLADPFYTKLSSQFSCLRLYLVPTQKLLNKIKQLSPASFLVGFKLESNTKKSFMLFKVKTLFKEAHCDLVVGNCIRQKSYTGYIVDKRRDILARALSRNDLSKKLVNILKKEVNTQG